MSYIYHRSTYINFNYCITSVEKHQSATYDFGCSREELFLGDSFSMVDVLGGGDSFVG